MLQNGTYSQMTNKIQYSQKIYSENIFMSVSGKRTTENNIKSGWMTYFVQDIIQCRILLTRIS